MRLIDADELRLKIENICGKCKGQITSGACERCYVHHILGMIDGSKTVKPEITYREERIAIGEWTVINDQK